MIIMGFAYDVQETHHHVRTILDGIGNLSRLDHVIACDMKLLQILCGQQSAASKHPCSYCQFECGTIDRAPSSRAAEDSGIKPAKPREVEKILQQKARPDKLLQSEFPPLLKGDKNLLMLDKVPPMELHLLLVNHIHDDLVSQWPQDDQWH